MPIYIDTSAVSIYVARPPMGDEEGRIQHALAHDAWMELLRQKVPLIATTALLEEAERGNADAARKRVREIRAHVTIRRETKAILSIAGDIESRIIHRDHKKQAAERARLRLDIRHYVGACVLRAPYLLTKDVGDFHYVAGLAATVGSLDLEPPKIEDFAMLFGRLVRNNPPLRSTLLRRIFAIKTPFMRRIDAEHTRNALACARDEARRRNRG